MLVLTRRVEEAIIIGGNVTVKVLSVKGGRVRLGIDAPPEVRVNRGEVETAVEMAEERISSILRRSGVLVGAE